MKCPNCGETSRIRERDKFCHKCGANLKKGKEFDKKSNISIVRTDSRSLFQIGNEQVEIADYNIKSSADGSTELSIVIKGQTTIFELSANLEEQRK